MTIRVKRALGVVAFSNPLLDFDQIVFLKRHRPLYDHMGDQHRADMQ